MATESRGLAVRGRRLEMDEVRHVDGLVTIASRYGVAETLRRLLELLEKKGAKVFAVIDHSGEARAAGLEMPETKVVIFGDPKAGTPVMKAAPTAAIDLPLKLLIREDEQVDGQAQALVSYNSAEFLAVRHGIPAELSGVLKGVEALARAITD